MESIFKTVDKLLKEHPKDDLDDLMTELEQNKPTLDELLKEAGYTYEEALKSARAEKIHRADQAKRCGVFSLHLPYVWSEIIEQCDKEPSKDKLDFMLWLIAGGEPINGDDLSDEEAVLDWLNKTKRIKESSKYLTVLNQKMNEFVEISLKIDKAKLIDPEKHKNAADTDFVFNLLCKSGYADDKENNSEFRKNIGIISGIIAELPYLEPIKPLIYFQSFVRQRKKILNKNLFIINIKKLFSYREYDLREDNGKNYMQSATYCALYSDLKKCFPDADIPLCDVGFMYCSNLTEWWYTVCTNGYECDREINIPIGIEAFISEQGVSCFKESEIGKTMNVSSEQLVKWRNSNSTLRQNIHKAVQKIIFSDLRAFADNSTEFCGKLFNQNQLEGAKPVDHSIAWALFVRGVEHHFDELLEEELVKVITKSLHTLSD